jgi:hypothetical protein
VPARLSGPRCYEKPQTHSIRGRARWRARHHGGVHQRTPDVWLHASSRAARCGWRYFGTELLSGRFCDGGARPRAAIYDGVYCSDSFLRTELAFSAISKTFEGHSGGIALWSGGVCGQQFRYRAVHVVGSQPVSAYADLVQAPDGLVATGHSPVLRRPAYRARDAPLLQKAVVGSGTFAKNDVALGCCLRSFPHNFDPWIRRDALTTD